MSNPNRENDGGCAEPEISKHVPKNVSVTSPDHRPSNEALAGKTFLGGSPQGREAQPKPKHDGWTY